MRKADNSPPIQLTPGITPLPDHPRTAEVGFLLGYGGLSPPNRQTPLPSVPGMWNCGPHCCPPLRVSSPPHNPVPNRPLGATTGGSSPPLFPAFLRPPPGPAPPPISVPTTGGDSLPFFLPSFAPLPALPRLPFWYQPREVTVFLSSCLPSPTSRPCPPSHFGTNHGR